MRPKWKITIVGETKTPEAKKLKAAVRLAHDAGISYKAALDTLELCARLRSEDTAPSNNAVGVIEQVLEQAKLRN